MVYSKTPSSTYYSTLHDSITSLCKTLLPLSLKKRCLVSAEHKLWNLQSQNLKWQHDSLQQMNNLMSLHHDDIISDAEVSAFTTHLLDTLLASTPPQHDHPLIIKDKLLFLEELLNAKCISEGEYHSCRRPLLQRLAAQGGEIEGSKDTKLNPEQEEWSVIELKDEQCLMNKENSNSKKKSKQVIKGAASLFSFGSSYKHGKKSFQRSIFDSPFLQLQPAPSKLTPSYVFAKSEMSHSKENPSSEKTKRKPFRTLFHRDKNERGGNAVEDHNVLEGGERKEKSAKKQSELNKWKTRDSEDDDTVPLSLNERYDNEAYLASYELSSVPYGEVLDTKLVKNKLHSDVSPSDFSKVLGEKISEISRVQTEMRSTNPNLNYVNDQVQAISTKLPEDKAEFKNNFSKPWYDQCGDMVYVAKKEFKENAKEKHENSMGWTTFEDDEENLHPNLFVHQDKALRNSSINPFSHA